MSKGDIIKRILLVVLATSGALLLTSGVLIYIFFEDIFNRQLLFNIYTIITVIVPLILSFALCYITSLLLIVRPVERLKEKSEMAISNLSDEKSNILVLLDHLTEGLIVFDSEGQLNLVNSKALNLINLPRNQLNYNAFCTCFDIDITLEELVYVESSVNRVRKASRNDHFYEIEFVVSFEGQERAKNIIIVIKDCTEQRKLDEMRKDFIANVSHELKTPLTSIATYTEALMDGAISDPELSKNFLSVVSSEAARMGRLVSDLLQLSQIDRQAFPLNKRRLSFENIVRSCVEKIKIDAENHGLFVESYVIGEIPEIYMDADRIEQVLLNVLSNAVKYTPEKGKISVYTGKTFSQVYAKITDTGIGIPRESLDRVFERFYRVDKARTREQGGTGLGLAISREIIEAHGGEITISSEFGVGTEVTIKLPIKSKTKPLY